MLTWSKSSDFRSVFLFRFSCDGVIMRLHFRVGCRNLLPWQPIAHQAYCGVNAMHKLNFVAFWPIIKKYICRIRTIFLIVDESKKLGRVFS